MTGTYLNQIEYALSKVKPYSNDEIEAAITSFVCNKFGLPNAFENEYQINDLRLGELTRILEDVDFPCKIDFLIEFFEALLERETIEEHGIVFTPKYIADYIAQSSIVFGDAKVIDPGCGCGIFLIQAAQHIKDITKKTYVRIFNENIYGIELNPDNARRCKVIIKLFILMNGESIEGLEANIVNCDSLKSNWLEVFDVEGFDYIIGNPPYVNTHDMSKETALFLKKTFNTTKTGVYNIFYAFVEYAMEFLSEKGKLSYIVPNNFLTIKSAYDLRKFITSNYFLESILDFAGNMVFKPVRTYNCIIVLSKAKNAVVNYCVMDDVDDIEKAISNIKFMEAPVERFNNDGWRLTDQRTYDNICTIESQFMSIKQFIHTGIATLKDDVFLIDKDDEGYYKDYNGQRFEIEDDYVVPIYKVPELKLAANVEGACRYIIFPYYISDQSYSVVPEEDIIKKAPKMHEYLLLRKAELDSRDKGNPKVPVWYAYGRTQGLNRYGRKLMFPTFAAKPKFTMINNEKALFCNGYAVFENDFLELDILVRILNSIIMEYYVRNTSYSIEGGFYCYQKKFIEHFSIPNFTPEEKEKIRMMSDESLDRMLIEKYNIQL